MENRTRRIDVEIASCDSLSVRRCAIEERMSSLFEITLEVVSPDADIDFDAAIGREARLTIEQGSDEATVARTWTGITRDLQQIAVEEGGLSTYRVIIVPTLWLLTQRRNYRMFQQATEVDIALALLAEWGIEPILRLGGTYKKRKYRVQYGESDFAFVSRMLEDAGISFHFETQGGMSRLVLADAPHTMDPRAPLRFRDAPTIADREHVTRVRVGRRVRPGRYTMRDHDYRKDPSFKLLAGAVAKDAPIEAQLERYHYVPGAFLFGAEKGDDTPAADDKGKTRTDDVEAAALAQRRLDAQRGGARSVTFATNVLDIAPGSVLSIVDHPRRELGPNQSLLVVATSRAIDVDGTWSAEVEARTTEVPHRPELSTPKPKVSGVESATVVGAPGDEIHTDEFGRVRVHFHWDRESKMNDDSSCWLHVSQPWGGAGYGGTNLPRVGQEVIVDFLSGDPDRPIIIGRVYTNLQKAPYALPANKTQSGMKSNSTGGTGGYNEIMFEDAGGGELLRMQAEKDMQKLVKNDEESTVGRHRTRRVGGDEDVTIGQNQTRRVALNQRETTGHTHSISVGVNRSAHVGAIDATTAGKTIVHMVSPPGEGIQEGTAQVINDNEIKLTTPGGAASITMKGDTITLDAREIILRAGDDLTISSSGGVVTIKGGPLVKINPPAEPPAAAPAVPGRP